MTLSLQRLKLRNIFGPLVAILATTSCATEKVVVPQLAVAAKQPVLVSFDGRELPMQVWNEQAKPRTIIIGLHGLGGASRDMGNLGRALSESAPRTTLFAPNLRGMGYDPETPGDIKQAEYWIKDLEALNALLRARYPAARIVWLGESLGSMIVLNAAVDATQPPAALVLTSPVIDSGSVTGWQRFLLRVGVALFPKAHLSLAKLAGDSLQLTENTTHNEQNEKNSYYIDKVTLRLLAASGKLAEGMKEAAAKVELPVLIMQGGKDTLSPAKKGPDFAKLFAGPNRYLVFDESYHLLFYDRDRDDVIAALLKWLQ